MARLDECRGWPIEIVNGFQRLEPIINKEQNMSASRVSLGQAAPELYQAVAGLDGLAGKLATAAGIGEGLSQLLKLRA